MSPVLLQRSQIDDDQWDELISCCRQSVIYARSFYLDIVCDDWQALIYQNEAGYQIVMPLPVMRKWYMQVLVQPLFCQYLGIFSRRELSQIDCMAFLNAVSAHFRYISSYQFNPENYSVLKVLKDQFNEFFFEVQHTYWLDLSATYQDIYQHYYKDRKINLKRSKKAVWVLEKGECIRPMVELFTLYHAGNIQGGVREGAYKRLQAIFKSVSERGLAEVWYARRHDLIHAGILIVKSGDRLVYLFNAADKVGRKENARTLMLDSCFAAHAGLPFTFDFESPEIESIASFYKSFGGNEIPFYKISKNKLIFPFRQVQNWRKRHLLKTR